MPFGLATRILSTAVLLLPVWVQADSKIDADDQAEVVKTVRSFFNALQRANDADFEATVTPDFYSFEGGMRFSEQQLLQFIKAQRSAGRSYKWSVQDADVHVSGEDAWIAYLNRGSISDSSGAKDQAWLESAFLKKEGTGWRIAFLHSTRVPPLVQSH
jgi:ketosteroid isomerase-like protein